MPRPVRVLSLYEGFFAGGARILHTDVVQGLHAGGGQRHSVLSVASHARRESTVQPIHRDPRFVRLARDGIDVVSLGRTAGSEPLQPASYTDRQLRLASEAVRRADVVLSLKEQPLGLLLALRRRGMMPDIPVAVALHRSDPMHSGPALEWLANAAEIGLLTGSISCAESTSAAYGPYLGRGPQRFVVPNGIDTRQFRPGTAEEQVGTRAALGIPIDAPVVVLAARFDAMKDAGLFLRAVAVHARRRPGTRYVLCGAGMTRENPAFATLLDESGIGADLAVHALGIRSDMPAIFQIADIVALTSAFGEASPLCLIEGAACGATPVTTDVGDSARAVEGIGVVTGREPAGIAAAWDDVLDHRAALREVALAERPRFGRDRMIEEYRAAIEALLEVRQAAA